MSEETQVATETVSEGTTPQTPTETPDVGSLIAESKKYRQRSQDAEAQLAKLQSKLEEQENVKLKEKEEFKTLAEKFESQVNDLSPYKEKYEAMVDARKQKLLDRLPEEQRDKFKDKDLETLEFAASLIAQNAPTEAPARGSIPTKSFDGDWTKMDADERRANWSQIVSNFNKK
mgnify:CR=1 FL=1